MRSSPVVWSALLLAAAGVTGCGGGEETPDVSPPPDEVTPTPLPVTPTSTVAPPEPTATPDHGTPAPPGPTSTPPEPTPVYLGEAVARPPRGEDVVQVERVAVPSHEPPANPSPGGSDTGPSNSPDDYNYSTYLRYHYKDSTRPVEVILLGMPGFQGGAGDYDYIGRTLVSQSEGRIEVWAIDRRSNQLEDHRGTEAAELEAEAGVALSRGLDYYFAGASEEGSTFSGFLSNPDYPYLSEWGLELTLRDAYTIAQTIPTEWRNRVLFLAGHSLGGAIVQSFAAWDFDGNPETQADAGYNQLAGLLMLDGGIDPDPSRVTGQSEYEASLAALRSGESGRVASFAGLTSDVNVLLELFALAEVRGPAEEAPIASVYDYPGVNQAYLNLLYGSGRYTHRAVLGLAIDDNFQTAYVFEASAGFATGGPIESYRRGQAVFYRPADMEGGTLYGWLDYDELTDQLENIDIEENTHIDDVAYACFKGPANFTEWYFPSRLSTDLGLVIDLDIKADGSDWRYNEYGMATVHNKDVNIPVMAVFTDNTVPDSGLATYEGAISPTLRDGSSRSGNGFQVITAEGYEHLDVLMADIDHPVRPNEVLSRLPDWFTQYGVYGTGQGPAPSELGGNERWPGQPTGRTSRMRGLVAP